METNVRYLEHINILKEYHTKDDGTLINSTDDFEKIYEKSKEANLKLTNAKEFLNSLSNEELASI